MSGKSDDINFPMPTKSEPGINSPEGSSSTFKYEDPELVDHYEFFKLCKINIEEDDVTSLLWRTDIPWRKFSSPYKTLQQMT